MFSRNEKLARFEEVWRSNPLQIVGLFSFAFMGALISFGTLVSWAPHAWQPGGEYWAVIPMRGGRPKWAFELDAGDRWLWWTQLIATAGMLASFIAFAVTLAVSLVVASVRGKTSVHQASKLRKLVMLWLFGIFFACGVISFCCGFAWRIGGKKDVPKDAILVPHESTPYSF